ncbi:glycosyltransferase [Bellilinea caldifistulae]|uniref:Glycosyltransferase family 1 protein n=1 Tax=Bellilinea caldifistulae TaxID=360411 RepID=A0A0P6X7S0_9CHLR|nr:glycosyltransferase family 4 protein [Bellilinea caldifistulae]KPL78030.1 hypothetical protein AC812_02110 [Bellilinea caldifistulae]GAP10774.1 glycosyltransferase [Bellilinea caldifistulae]
MKIGYLAQLSPELRTPPFDGPANHIRHIVHEWQEMGHQILFIGGMGNDYWISKDLKEFSSIRNGQKKFLERPIRKFQTLSRLPYVNYYESQRFSDVILENLSGIDWLYERTSWMSYGGLLAAKKRGLPLILEFNGDPLLDLKSKGQIPGGLQLIISKALFRFTLGQATHIIASGQGWKKNLIEKWSVAQDKISVVENGTVLVNLLRRNELANFQNKNPQAETRIVYLGSFFPWHGTKLAINAFRELLRSGINAHLFMIGSGSDLQETQTLAKQLGIEDRVTFTGSLSPEEYAEILATCEIGLSPYCGWSEFSGLKLFDYKAAGLAIIASGQNGQPETLVHNKTGLIIPPCDEKALLDALKLLANDRKLTISLGQQARMEAEEMHTWRKTAENIISIINQVIEQRK